MPHSAEFEEKLQKKLKQAERLLARTNKRLGSTREGKSLILRKRQSRLMIMAVNIEMKTNEKLRETHEFLKSISPKPEDFFKRIGVRASV